MILNEIDISDKVKRAIKFGLPSLLILSVVVASMIWYAMYGTGDLVVITAGVPLSVSGTTNLLKVQVVGDEK